MEIGYINKNNSIKPQQIQERPDEAGKGSNAKTSTQYAITNKMDSAEISSSNPSFNDKRIAIAKSAILYDVSVNSSVSRVAELKAQVEAGTYDISSEKLADSILDA